ncbi:MAG: transposase [Paracoccus aminovorans]|nr:transposase [Paracoccus aminovorans]
MPSSLNNPSRARKHPLDKHLCARRHPIECCFSKLKQFRRVATRYEKTARNHLAVITIAAIVLWTKEVSTEPRVPAPIGGPWRHGG